MLLSMQTSLGQESDQKQKIKIGLRLAPPFVMKFDSMYNGVGVELWEQIAPGLNLDYEYTEYQDLGNMLKAIERGDVDLCINPLTVTSERLEKFSFTQPYYISGMAIAVKVEGKHGLLVFLGNLFSAEFLKVILLLFFVIFVFGSLIWLVERRKNPEQFGKGVKGLGHGIWWSAVTMTTVGYGDKSPTTGIGRMISIVWMFTAVIIVSSFTASISAALTYKKFKTDIRNVRDLRGVSVGTIRNSSTASYLSEIRVPYKGFETPKDALIALEAGLLDVIVYDEPLLSWLIHSEGLAGLVELIPSGVNSVYFGFASHDIEFVERINPHLIDAIEGPAWKKLLENHNLQLNN
jgi:ABC-type amino acid transport substrate-binding protein